MRLKKGPPDFMLFICTLTLLGIGIVMVFSSSSVTANLVNDDAYYYLKKQLQWAGIGLVAMVLAMKFNYNKLKALALPLFAITVLCLIAVLTPLGVTVNGASRWLGVESMRFAPAEVAKLTIVLFLAKYMEVNYGRMKSFARGVLPILIIIAVTCGLILKQPDLGTSFSIAGTIFCMMIVAGARWTHLSLLTISGAGLIAGAIINEPYRFERFAAFLDPWKYPKDDGFQIIQSLYALGSGGIFGLGLGRSRQKFFYLPEQHTDFILAILGEELGFLGIAVVLFLFIFFAWRGYRIALNAPDTFGNLLASGLTTMVIFQAAINIGVVAGCLPVTGITLPFISYGGTSLIFTMIAVGLLLNISRYSTNN